jgi:hypothetical protein
MHKEKNLEMSHKGFFLLGTHQKKKKKLGIFLGY